MTFRILYFILFNFLLVFSDCEIVAILCRHHVVSFMIRLKFQLLFLLVQQLQVVVFSLDPFGVLVVIGKVSIIQHVIQPKVINVQ